GRGRWASRQELQDSAGRSGTDRVAEPLPGRHAHRLAGERLVERLRDVLDARARRLVQVVVDAAAVEDLPLLVADQRLAGALRGQLLRDGGVGVGPGPAAHALLPP